MVYQLAESLSYGQPAAFLSGQVDLAQCRTAAQTPQQSADELQQQRASLAELRAAANAAADNAGPGTASEDWAPGEFAAASH